MIGCSTRSRLAALVAVTLAVCGAGFPARGAEPAATASAYRLSDNAALLYWQAIISLPRDTPTLPAPAASLDQKSLEYLKQAQTPLRLLRRGAAMPGCDWGISLDDGPATLLPHLSQMRTLGDLALLSARHEFESGDKARGAADLAAAMVMARHVSRPSMLITRVVEARMLGAATDEAARLLPAMGPGPRAEFARRLDALPPAGLPGDSMRIERLLFADWLRKHVGDPRMGEEMRGLFGETFDEVREILADKDRAAKAIDEFAGFYDEAALAMNAPPDKSPALLRNLYKKVETAGPLARLLFPSLDAAVYATARAETRRQMLSAAIAVLDKGPAALTKYSDPYGDGPFTYRKIDSGFELASKLMDKSKPVTLAIGPADRPK